MMNIIIRLSVAVQRQPCEQDGSNTPHSMDKLHTDSPEIYLFFGN
ncbi:hypothetical protein W822_13530 [Advenella kashmirensis W13003]|uniref:Uncharacterized protein n=1 Tax=Advenella kashmirensis W13003 TaxID=1424334 RepID=V8QQV6_9BURK|nr:hypothetical protein W822_13530 [Advenella kashmirensis W13003]